MPKGKEPTKEAEAKEESVSFEFKVESVVNQMFKLAEDCSLMAADWFKKAQK